MAETLTVRKSLKRSWRETTWKLAVLSIFLDAATTQAVMWTGGVEANPIWATLFNEHNMLWPVAIAMMVVLTAASLPLLTTPLDKRLDWLGVTIWLMLATVFAFRIPTILNNWYIAVQGF